LKPEEALLFRTRAQIELAQEELVGALGDFEKALLYEPKGSLVRAVDYTECGRIHHRQGKFKEAVARYDAALAIQPHLALTHRLRANALLEMQQFADAVRAFDAYLENGKPSAEVFEGRGLARAKLDHYQEAIADFTKGLGIASKSPSLLRARGWVYIQSEAPKLALTDFEMALVLVPGCIDAFNGRGFANALIGKTTGAVADAEQAARLESHDPHDLAKTCRIYTYLAFHLSSDTRVRLLPIEKRKQYLDRAVALLSSAWQAIPTDEQRARFCRDIILPDPVLRPLGQTQSYIRIETEFKLPARCAAVWESLDLIIWDVPRFFSQRFETAKDYCSRTYHSTLSEADASRRRSTRAARC